MSIKADGSSNGDIAYFDEDRESPTGGCLFLTGESTTLRCVEKQLMTNPHCRVSFIQLRRKTERMKDLVWSQHHGRDRDIDNIQFLPECDDPSFHSPIILTTLPLKGCRVQKSIPAVIEH